MEAEEEATKKRGRKRQSGGLTKISHFYKATVSPSRTVHRRQPFFVAAGLSPVESLWHHLHRFKSTSHFYRKMGISLSSG